MTYDTRARGSVGKDTYERVRALLAEADGITTRQAFERVAQEIERSGREENVGIRDHDHIAFACAAPEVDAAGIATIRFRHDQLVRDAAQRVRFTRIATVVHHDDLQRR